MELTRLLGFLHRHQRIAIDTNVFIYQFQANPRYLKLTAHVFEWLGSPRHSAVTSAVTMAELLVQPYRTLNHYQVSEFYALLSRYSNLEWISATLDIADTAARIKALHRLRTPDALLAATAIRHQATGLVTNDSAFERVDDFETVVLERLL